MTRILLRMRWGAQKVFFSVCASGVVWAACTGAIREPRQNDNWTLAPARYGDVYFQGLRAPNELDGGGVGSAIAESEEPPPKINAASRPAPTPVAPTPVIETPSARDAGAAPSQEREIFID